MAAKKLKSDQLFKPKTIDTPAELLERGCGLERRIKELKTQIKVLEDDQDKIKAALRLHLENSGGLTKLSGLAGEFVQINNEVPIISDYQALVGYIVSTGHAEVFQKRLSAPAIRELMLTEAVDGVKFIEVKSFHFKVKK